MTSEEVFTELRALLQEPPSDDLRLRFYAVLSLYIDAAAPLERERFEHAYLPALLETIDAQWPYALQWSDVEDIHKGEALVSRVVCVEGSELEPDEVPTLQGFDGLWFLNDSQDPIALLESLMLTFQTLRHVELVLEARPEACLQCVIDHHAQTVEHITLRPWYNDPIASEEFTVSYIGAFVNQLDHLPSLRSITVDRTFAGNHSIAWLPHLFAHPQARALESLAFYTQGLTFDLDWLRDARLPHLQRLRILGLQEERAQEVLRLDSLSHVVLWNLDPSLGLSESRTWEDASTLLWTALARGEPLSTLLQRSHVELALKKSHLFEVFGCADGGLHPSRQLVSLHIDYGHRALWSALWRHGHEAYPNLHELTLRVVMPLSAQDYETLEASPLLDQLEVLSWRLVRCLPADTTFRTQEQEALRPGGLAQWVEISQCPHLRPLLRRLAWDAAVDNAAGYGRLEWLASHVGVSPLGEEGEIHARLLERAPEV